MRDQINRQSSVPLYQQLYDLWRGRILAGEWRPGDMLPTESDLLEQHQVSRVVVRQALNALVQEGLIYRQRGRGTFVAHPTVEQGLVRIVSFTEEMQQRGFKPETEVLGAELISAAPDIAAQLAVTPGAELVHIERLRLADGEPMSIEASYLVHSLCPNILSRHNFAEEPLREVLERDFGLRLGSARQSIRAIAAEPARAEVLCMQAGAPLLFIERVSFTPQSVPVEFLRIFHRGDRYVLYNELRG